MKYCQYGGIDNGCIIRIGMSWTEHTPPEYSMREAPAEPPVFQSPQDQTIPSQETSQENKCPPAQSAQTIRVRELHLYTIPSREYSGHYPNSQLFHDVAQNPALYMDRADF